jgi:hypothetical protein
MTPHRAEAPSYPVSIFVGGGVWEAETICLAYCDEVGLCVTVTETTYLYTGGETGGVIVGLINYPRFPSTPAAIWGHAEALALRLIEGLKQESASIQAPDKTVWISFREQSETGKVQPELRSPVSQSEPDA